MFLVTVPRRSEDRYSVCEQVIGKPRDGQWAPYNRPYALCAYTAHMMSDVTDMGPVTVTCRGPPYLHHTMIIIVPTCH